MMFYTLYAQTVTDSATVVRSVDEVARYKLYPTTNMWTFLKLDTRNGRIWQVQWSFEDDKLLKQHYLYIQLYGKTKKSMDALFYIQQPIIIISSCLTKLMEKHTKCNGLKNLIKESSCQLNDISNYKTTVNYWITKSIQQIVRNK